MSLDTDLVDLVNEIVETNKKISNLLAGKTVEVISDFNDQPYGHSRPSLKGKRFKVRSADVDPVWKEVNVWLEHCRSAPLLWHDVVIVEDV